ncbi:MAG: starch synthase [Betaproteobacteria bacterium]|jgi:starch synthase|nr:starch synthase [Betaproteobacteria bacterium]
MRLLFVTPECAPLTKTGGLGDVSAALPAALRGLGVDVRTLLPGYTEVLEKTGNAVEAAKLRVLGVDVRLLEAGALLVIDCPTLYRRDGGPYQDASGADWGDNALRFAVLSKVASLLAGAASPLAWRPECVHCNDWPAALAAAYLAFDAPVSAASIVTVHNLAFQGNFDPALLGRLGLPPQSFTLEGLEFHGRLSFLKAGLAYADALTTVSPSYAREIQGEEFGCGLDGLLRQRRQSLTGILNGIDTDQWNPAADPLIAEPYDAERLEGKAANKEALQRRLGLKVDSRIPLLGVVSRLTHQKGSDLLAAVIDELAALPAQVAVLGKGDTRMEDALALAASRHAGSVSVTAGFDEGLAHAIEAGADIFLMPSRYEPCGLNQMYSQRYGTPPVAHATGGLIDTIEDGKTGFLFARPAGDALVEAVRRAIELRRDAGRWREMQRRGMQRDFSWSAAARQYAALYSRLAMRAPA